MIDTSSQSLDLSSDFLAYLAGQDCEQGARLPPIPELARELGISTGKLREQLEVARILGLVEVRPKTGIRFLGYDFFRSISLSLKFALALDRRYFEKFGVLRNNVEACFWREAVSALRPEDVAYLEQLVDRAHEKLHGSPIQIPHAEHCELHLTIFSRLENAFVRGILEAYWEAYEAVGLNVYADYAYLQEVWTYHRQMVEAIVKGDVEAGYQALVEHTGLLQNRPELARFKPVQSVEPLGEDGDLPPRRGTA